MFVALITLVGAEPNEVDGGTDVVDIEGARRPKKVHESEMGYDGDDKLVWEKVSLICLCG